MVGTRLIVTAESEKWVTIAASVMTGYATSVIACDCEAGVERTIPPAETPDGRAGISLLVFGFGREKLADAVVNRVGQCLLTCATTACFNGLFDTPKEKQIKVGGQLRYFGDQFQGSKKLLDRRFWRIPVMDGEFLCEDRFGTIKGVAGGNLLIGGCNQSSALRASENAVQAIQKIEDVITPFPGGIVRSGSKVGSRYKALKASTNDAYCPTIRPVTQSKLLPETNALYEIVIDGLTESAVQSAMKAGLHAAAASKDVTQISAGNYGGELGPFHFHLKELL